VALAWRLKPIALTRDGLAFEAMEEALMGNPASPLKRALIASGLGSDLADGSGLNQECADAYFAIGLKEVTKKDLAKVPALIIKTLKKLAREGVSGELAEGALNSLRFDKLEVTNNPYPYGLKIWLSLVGPWLMGAEPVQALADAIRAVQDGSQAKPRALTALIK
jgi:hypothetical protein